MQVDTPDTVFVLSNVEVETLRRAAIERSLPFDTARNEYSGKELHQYGLVREAYNSLELQAFGLKNNRVITSFDAQAKRARDKLLVDAPFANKIRKWQIPVDICEWRTFIAEFPIDTFVEPHVHPENTPTEPGGSLRTILKGSVTYAGNVFHPGDWFYIPNGVPYSFRTSKMEETIAMYLYRFFAVSEGNRFSHPVEVEKYRVGVATSAA